MSEMKVGLGLLLMALCGTHVHAEPAALAPDTRVRLQSDWVDGEGWHTGVVADANPCTRIRLDQPMPGGFNRIALMALSRLQIREESGTWTEVELPALVAREPTGCHEEGSSSNGRSSP